jgi:hypothetical protein
MVYPVNFHRVVIGGSIYTETWQTTFAFKPFTDRASDQSLATTLAAAVQGWFTGNGANMANFSSVVKLTHLKVNRIAVNGHYQDSTSIIHNYPANVSGGSTAVSFPPQLATVATLRTAFARGRASRGRMYLPAATGYYVVGADGRASAADAIRIASSVSSLFNNVKAGYSSWLGGGDGGNVAVMSNVGLGDWHIVTNVEVGRVVDSMRSRRSSLAEDYQDSTIAITA